MGRIIRLTERDLTRLVKRIIREEQTNVNDDYYSIDEKSIFEPAYGYGGGYWLVTLRGTEVWLNNKAQTSWPAGDAVKTKKAAYKLLNAISGLDITGSGAKLAQEVANEWKTYGLIDQNEFLKQWYKLGNKDTPWDVLFDDNEQEIASQMIDHSIARVKTYCQPYADQKTKAARGVGTSSKNVICDLFVTNNLLGIWDGLK
jgi:hypothetical protein